MDADIALSAGMQQSSEHAAEAATTAAASSSSFAALASRTHPPKPLASPPPPHVPKYLAPAPADYKGYKLDAAGLPSTIIPLAQPLDMTEGAAASGSASVCGTNAAPTSFHAVSQKLKANQLVVLRSETERGAHAVYYCDHKGIWQLDPPGAVSTTAAGGAASPSPSSSSASQGGSHLLYEFDSVEDGDGLSFVGVSPCILLLTRGGGRLTIFLVRPEAGHQLSTSGADAAPITVLFDGSPLSPAPLSPHHATISSALLSAKRDLLFVVLQEYWPEHVDKAALAARKHGIEFVHQSDAIRGAGAVGPQDEIKEGFTAIATTQKHALHKLTLVQFSIHNVAALRVAGETKRNAVSEGTPSMQLIHSFSSVQNQLLSADEMPPQFANDSNWSAPLACWLQLPTPSTHHATAAAPASTASVATPHTLPCLWYVVARVPYLNETESVLHELERLEANKSSVDKQAKMQMDRADEFGSEAVPVSAIGSGSAAASSSAQPAAAAPKFTSESLLGSSQGLKNYSVDAEDDDDEFMNETGLAIDDPSRTSLNRNRDAEVSAFDRMGNLLARRCFRGQQFLFAANHESVSNGSGSSGAGNGNGSKASNVVGVKNGEELVLYAVSAAPQSTPEGLSLGAGGCCAPSCSAQTPGLGIVLKPLLSFAGLGYVVSGKPHRKFFVSDASHSWVVLVEYNRLGYVYGRPSVSSPTAPQYLIQLGPDEEDQGQQMYGFATTIVPAASGGGGEAGSSSSSSEAPVQGKPLLYLLTRHSCRQYMLPIVTLPA